MEPVVGGTGRKSAKSGAKAGKGKGKGGKGKGKGGKGGKAKRTAKPKREPEPEPEVPPTPGAGSPERWRVPSPGSDTGGGSRLQQEIADALKMHERFESSIESMGRQLFTDTKKRSAAKERLDRETEALELLRQELETFNSVACPVCSERFPKREIQSHVDGCLACMLEQIEKTVEQVPGVQRALRPRPVRSPSPRSLAAPAAPAAAATASPALPAARAADDDDRVTSSEDEADASSLNSFDLEGSTGPGAHGATTWKNPLARSSTRHRPTSRSLGGASPMVGRSSVRVPRDEQLRLRQRRSPSRPQPRSPQRQLQDRPRPNGLGIGTAALRQMDARFARSDPEATVSSSRRHLSPRARGDNVMSHSESSSVVSQQQRAHPRSTTRGGWGGEDQRRQEGGGSVSGSAIASPRAAWLDTSDDMENDQAGRRRQQASTSGNGNGGSWADRHPGLAKLVASADTPPTRRPSPPRMWDAVPGVAATDASGLAVASSPAVRSSPPHGNRAVADITGGSRGTVAAITPPLHFNSRYWLEQSDDPREWSTSQPAAGTTAAAGAAPEGGESGAIGVEALPPPPPPPLGDLTASIGGDLASGVLDLPPPSSAAAAAAPSLPSPQGHGLLHHRGVAADLRDLQSLQSEGLITAQEFEAQKAAVLARGLTAGATGSGIDDGDGSGGSGSGGGSGRPYAWQAQMDELGWGGR